MKIRFFLDEDVHAELSHALRNRGFDVLHAQELKRKGKTDREQLEFATEEKRCILSFNVKDFVILHSIQEKAGSIERCCFPWGITNSAGEQAGKSQRRSAGAA